MPINSPYVHFFKDNSWTGSELSHRWAALKFPRWKFYFSSEDLPQQVWLGCQQQLFPELAEIQSLSQVHFGTGWTCGWLVWTGIKRGTPWSQDGVPLLWLNCMRAERKYLPIPQGKFSPHTQTSCLLLYMSIPLLFSSLCPLLFLSPSLSPSVSSYLYLLFVDRNLHHIVCW